MKSHNVITSESSGHKVPKKTARTSPPPNPPDVPTGSAASDLPLGKARRRQSHFRSEPATVTPAQRTEKGFELSAPKHIPLLVAHLAGSGSDEGNGDSIALEMHEHTFICHYNGIRKELTFWKAYYYCWLCQIAWVLPINWYRAEGFDDIDSIPLEGLRYDFALQVHLATHQGLAMYEFEEVIGREIQEDHFTQLKKRFHDKVGPFIEAHRQRTAGAAGPKAYRIKPRINYFVVEKTVGDTGPVDWNAFTVRPDLTQIQGLLLDPSDDL